jgi:hypothetical protein
MQSSIFITIRNGWFVGYRGDGKKIATLTHFSGNGWDGQIIPDGTIRIEATEEDGSELNYIRHIIHPDGSTKTSRGNYYTGACETTGVGRYDLTDGRLTGVLELTGGRIEDRSVRFLAPKYGLFLRRHGLSNLHMQLPEDLTDIVAQHEEKWAVCQVGDPNAVKPVLYVRPYEIGTADTELPVVNDVTMEDWLASLDYAYTRRAEQTKDIML